MWFGKKSSNEPKVTKRRTISEKNGYSVEYFEAKLPKKPKPAKRGLKVIDLKD